MTSKKIGTCVECGGPRWVNIKSGCLPDGQGRCQPCRQAHRRGLEAQAVAARTKPCKTCETVFTAAHAQTLYCSDACCPPRTRDSRRRQTTAARGYGNEHKKARQRLLAELVDGTPCPFCGQPMRRDQRLDLDHSEPSSRHFGAPGDRLTHAVCNRKDGSRRGRRCDCAVCSDEFAIFAGQRCAASARRVAVTSGPPRSRREPRPRAVPIYVKDCVWCGGLFTARQRKAKYCGRSCSLAQQNARYRDDPEFRARAIAAATARYHRVKERGERREAKL